MILNIKEIVRSINGEAHLHQHYIVHVTLVETVKGFDEVEADRKDKEVAE